MYVGYSRKRYGEDKDGENCGEIESSHRKEHKPFDKAIQAYLENYISVQAIRIFNAQSGQKVRIIMANTIKSGKTQFNVAEAKSFRDTLAVWHVYDFELDDEKSKRNKTINNCKGLIASNLEMIEKLQNGEKIGKYTVESLTQQNVDFQQKIDDARAMLEKWVEGQKSAVDKATALFPKSLYLAYVGYICDGNESAYSDAICEMFTANGLTPCSETVSALVASVGENKGTGSSKAETSKHNRAFSEGIWRQIFMGKVCDLMGSVLPTYKFKNILTREQRKALKSAK